MTISFIAGASMSQFSGTNPTLTHGLTIAANDVLIAVIHSNGTGNTITSDGSEFTDDFQENHPGGETSRGAIQSRVAGASEPSDYSWTLNASDRCQISLMQFRGVDTGDIWDVAPGTGTRANGASSTATTPSLTTLVNDAFGIAIYCCDDPDVTFSGYTNSYTNEVEEVPADQSCAAVSRNFASSGNQGTTAATLSSGQDWFCHQISLNPSVVITSVSTDDVIGPTETNWVIAGSGFGAD